MSIFDHCTIVTESAESTRKVGLSFAKCYRRKQCTISLQGDLGAGKTTFTQGFAHGLGIDDDVVSPTYALEQQYGDTLSHIDLYRLSGEQANAFLDHEIKEFDGVRLIEWPERASERVVDIAIRIEEISPSRRAIHIEWRDVPIPSDDIIRAWRADVQTPAHILDHMDAVANVCDELVTMFIKTQRPIRQRALNAAAKTHDLLRFVDFKDYVGADAPAQERINRWEDLRRTYGTPHERAAAGFLREKGYADIGDIVETHRGFHSTEGGIPFPSLEHAVLSYADKRVCHTTPVTLDQRFDEFMVRYGGGLESVEALAWRTYMKEVERRWINDETLGSAS